LEKRAIFHSAEEGFQCTAKGIFIPNDLTLDKISIKKHFKVFNF